jgi:(R,R)-butanediol dehydrogenase/meso-butanediol dehydrogenase/diacetyl reductase
LVEPTAVAAYGVDRGNVRPGDTILITGAGPIGALAALYAENLGARVFVSELNPNRQRMMNDLGIATLLDPTKDDVIAALKDATGGIGVDAVIECSGNERALQTAIKAVRSGGYVVQTGLHTKTASIEPMELAEREITYTGTWCYPVTDWPRIIGLIGRRGLPVEKVVSSKINMDDIVSKGFEELVSPTGTETKVLVRGH